jgi:uncharacterized protein (DUF1501 family)
MPTPAGTGLSRRSFLAKSAGLALSVYGASRLPLFDDGIAAAASGPAQPVLVSVFLEGGADALSVLFPSGDPDYRRLRPHLALPASAGTPFAEDDRLRWHPAAGGLVALHGERKVTVMPAIGYDHPDQSHFTSRHYWEVGAAETSLRTGWMGRYLDRVGTPDNPLQGLSLDDQLAPALATAHVPVASVDGPDQYDFWSNRVWGEVEQRMLDAIGSLGDIGAQAAQLRDQLLPFASGFTSPVAYPQSKDEFPKRLAGLAAMIAAGLPLRCVALTAPGHYDTHSDQAADLTAGLQLTSDSLLAFQRDLEARGVADRVLVHVWSEFGRRGAENGSAGTDHGAAGVGFLIGTRVKAQMIGEFPGLKNGLDDDGNLKPTADFRGLYCALLEQWFGADADGIVPNAARFARPQVV